MATARGIDGGKMRSFLNSIPPQTPATFLQRENLQVYYVNAPIRPSSHPRCAANRLINRSRLSILDGG